MKDVPLVAILNAFMYERYVAEYDDKVWLASTVLLALTYMKYVEKINALGESLSPEESDRFRMIADALSESNVIYWTSSILYGYNLRDIGGLKLSAKGKVFYNVLYDKFSTMDKAGTFKLEPFLKPITYRKD